VIQFGEYLNHLYICYWVDDLFILTSTLLIATSIYKYTFSCTGAQGIYTKNSIHERKKSTEKKTIISTVIPHIERVDIIFYELNHLKKQDTTTISFVSAG
jgi:hypothetical protein